MMTMNEICKVVIIDDDYTAIEDLKKGLAVYSDIANQRYGSQWS